MAEQRTRLLQIRMTPAEHDRVKAEAEACGMKASALGRERILGPNPPVISAREVDGGQGVSGGRVVYEGPPPLSPDKVAAIPGMRGCPNCGRIIGSPTMRYCGCGGKIEPPPRGT